MIVRDAPPGHPFLERRPETMGEMWRGLGEVFRSRDLFFILALNFTNYACTFTIQGLWGGPWLREIQGLSKIDAGNGPSGALTTAEKAELAVLRKEVRELRMEREILKKATTFFAKYQS